jgi:hypothetical protein
MRITAAGRLLIGTTTESTFLLDVAGTFRAKTSGVSSVAIFESTDNAIIELQRTGTSPGTTKLLQADSGEFYIQSPTRFILQINSATRLFVNSSGNVGVAQTTFGTSATNTFAISSGVAPTTSPADCFQLYSADITAGNAAAHFRTEGGAVIKVYQETTAVGSAVLATPGAGTNIKDVDTFDGYTIAQVVKALRNQGLLA